MILFNIPIFYNGLYDPRSYMNRVGKKYAEFTSYSVYEITDDETVVFMHNKDHEEEFISVPRWHFLFLLGGSPHVLRFDAVWRIAKPTYTVKIPYDQASVGRLWSQIDNAHYSISAVGDSDIYLTHPRAFPLTLTATGDAFRYNNDNISNTRRIYPGDELFYWGYPERGKRTRSPIDYAPMSSIKDAVDIPAIHRINITEPIHTKGWSQIWPTTK